MDQASIPATGGPSAIDLLGRIFVRAIDYAGLFPPASLDMETALRNYAGYRAGPRAGLLGRFVAPASRLAEFARVSDEIGVHGVRVAAVLGADFRTDLGAIAAFNAGRQDDDASTRVDSLEAKTDRPETIYELAVRAGDSLDVFIELAPTDDLELLVLAVRAARVSAKVRTGGVTPDAIPSSRSVVRFMRACLDAGVSFKGTAGLHHARTGTHALTYAPDSPQGKMFGFLNVFFAAAFLVAGMSTADAAALLDDTTPAAFTITDRGVTWRGHHVDADSLSATRARVFGSWGSCSFAEPVAELEAMTLLS